MTLARPQASIPRAALTTVPVTTITWAADWDTQPREVSLHSCPACGTLRRGRGQHAPRWRDGVVVDCAGIPVSEAKP